MSQSARFTTHRISAAPDAHAPDGSEIRLAGAVAGGSVAHGTLPPGVVSVAVIHRTVEEIWYVLSGAAELWRRQDDREEIVSLETGMAITIPLGTSFQFRTLGEAPFSFLMCTMPPWQGDGEAVLIDGHWPVAATPDV
jgi:mannose-6-phosphate isomerase-like protein (cupin superfamily)